MKKLFLTLIAISFAVSGFAQPFTLTPEGFMSSDDITKNYIVITLPNSTAEANFAKAKEFVVTTYRSPKDVMSETGTMMSLKGSCVVLSKPNGGAMDFSYSAIITCKEDRIRLQFGYEGLTPPNVSFVVRLSGGTMLQPSVFNKKGKPITDALYQNLNSVANEFYNQLYKYITQTTSEDW